MRRECRERFPRHRIQRKQIVSDSGMHRGTCVTHVPWWMSGLLTSNQRIWQEAHVTVRCIVNRLLYISAVYWDVCKIRLYISYPPSPTPTHHPVIGHIDSLDRNKSTHQKTSLSQYWCSALPSSHWEFFHLLLFQVHSCSISENIWSRLTYLQKSSILYICSQSFNWS